MGDFLSRNWWSPIISFGLTGAGFYYELPIQMQAYGYTAASTIAALIFLGVLIPPILALLHQGTLMTSLIVQAAAAFIIANLWDNAKILELEPNLIRRLCIEIGATFFICMLFQLFYLKQKLRPKMRPVSGS